MALRTFTLDITETGESKSIQIFDSNDIGIAYLVKINGTATYTVQHSLDDINFIDNLDNVQKTTDTDGNYILPIRSVRLNVEAISGTVTLVVRQKQV